MNQKAIYFTYGQECDYYAIVLRPKSDSNIIADVYKIENDFQEFDIHEKNTGDEVDAFVDEDDKILTLEVWSKYYFPTFTNNENQWYHRTEETETDYMDMLHQLMKFAYNLAIKEIIIYQ